MSKKNISEIQKDIIKNYGEIFHDIKMVHAVQGEVIPVSLGLDIGLNGGILEGTVTSLAGVSSAGKSTLALTICANAQKQKRKAFYIDVECRLTPSLLKTIRGLNAEELIIIRPTVDKFLTAQDYLNIMDQLINDEDRCVIVLDSVAVLCPDELHTVKHGESSKMMSIPTLMYNFFRKASQVLPLKRSNLILITHTQSSPSPYTPVTEVGGNAIKFQASTRITCLASKETPEKADKKTGRISEFKIYKSALGPGTGKVAFPIRYGAGYDYELDIATMIEELGLVSRAGSWYSFKDSEQKDVKIQGQEGLIQYLRDNKKESQAFDASVRKLTLDG